jgi:hypothetical protein
MMVSPPNSILCTLMFIGLGSRRRLASLAIDLPSGGGVTLLDAYSQLASVRCRSVMPAPTARSGSD